MYAFEKMSGKFSQYFTVASTMIPLVDLVYRILHSFVFKKLENEDERFGPQPWGWLYEKGIPSPLEKYFMFEPS